MQKWWYQRILVIVLLLTTIMGTGLGAQQIEASEQEHRVSNGEVDDEMVIPGGMPIGIYMETDGVLVLATECIECVDGTEKEPAKNLVKEGDYIVAINGEEIDNKKELIRAVNNLTSSKIILGIRRSDEYINVKLECAKVIHEKYKLGIWVKDNVQGLGTVTYMTTNSEFGALGHGIHDAETEQLLDISEGTVYETSIVGVQKGQKGEPGGLEGVIIYNRYNMLGTIEKNTDNGIFGSIQNVERLFDSQEAMKICKKEDVELGQASIRCTVDGKIEEYDILIKNVDQYTANDNKSIIIEIVDDELIELTGGIVQGMSGSPIIQNGKIVGAVTHVLVNDPTRGYGIFIEDMLKQ